MQINKDKTKLHAAADRLEVALSDGGKQRREDVSIAKLVDKVVRVLNDDSSQSPVDPARQHLLLDVCNERHTRHHWVHSMGP